jgi:hypothetical protein|nr:MAG TPA: hypothetical protein [Caudoviricetes sp.]
MASSVTKRWIEQLTETPVKKQWLDAVMKDFCTDCARRGTCECPEMEACFYTLDKPFYAPK